MPNWCNNTIVVKVDNKTTTHGILTIILSIYYYGLLNDKSNLSLIIELVGIQKNEYKNN